MAVVAAGSFLDGGRWEEVGKGILTGKKEVMDEDGDEENGEEEEFGKNGLWGGWPSKEEVWEYRQKSEWEKWGNELENEGEREGDDAEDDRESRM